jgi:uncharacterized membrane protein
MDSIDQKIRIGTCKAITDFEKNWTLLKIGTVYYHTFSEFKEEFGPTDINMLRYLCAYYSAENPVELQKIKDEKAKKALIAFLTKRKDAIRASEEFKSNSFIGKQPHTFVSVLEQDIKTLKGDDKKKGEAGEAGEAGAEAPNATRQTVSRDVLMKQFFKGLYLLSLTKGDKIILSKDYDELIKDLDELPLDEALSNTGEIKTLLKQNARIAMKTTQNSLLKYIKEETSGEGSTAKKASSAVKDNKSKLDIIKLITLFKTGKALNGLTKVKGSASELDSYLDGIASGLPDMVEDILLTYRSFTRFYRVRYTNIMIQYGKLMKTVGLENYPIELMIRLVFSMYNMMRYVNKDEISDRYKVFKQNQGLLRFTQAEPTSEYKAVLNLLEAYQGQFELIKDSSLDLSNKNDIVYQLLHIHAQNRKELETPILQLVSGKNILVDKTKLAAKLKELEASADASKKSQLGELKVSIASFFENKETTLYILYQPTPNNLLEPGTKIKQLNELQCGMANITDTLETVTTDSSGSEPDITIPRSIEGPKEMLKTKSEMREHRGKEILYNLVSANTFADFGITIKTPLELTQSITNITGTLLNSQYLNDKLKAVNKKLKDV